MKKIIFCIIFCFITCFIYAENSIILTDKKTGKQIGEYTLSEFETLIIASDNYKKLLQSETKGKIKINAVLEKENDDDIYISNIVIRYYDEKDSNFKTIYINDRFKIKENTDLWYKIKKVYYEVGAYSLPILILILILII